MGKLHENTLKEELIELYYNRNYKENWKTIKEPIKLKRKEEKKVLTRKLHKKK